MEKTVIDGYKKNDEERMINTKMLKDNGFADSGLYSTSGMFYVEKRSYGGIIVFGESCNIGGKNANKYFSLAKKFDSYKEAVKEFKKLSRKLRVKDGKN